MWHILKTFIFTTFALIYIVGIFNTSVLYIIYYLFYCKKPRLVYKQTEFNKIIANMKSLNKKFCPLILFIFGFAQTFIDRIRKMKKRTGYIVFEKRGGIFLLDDYQNTNPLVIREIDFDQICHNKNRQFGTNIQDSYIINRVQEHKTKYTKKDSILLIHGFNSSSDSNYIIGLAKHLTSDYNVFAFNSRGTKINLLTYEYFHIGYTDDVEHVLEYLLTVTDGRISIIGFSLGANWSAIIMSKIKNERIACGVGVSMPFDFVKLNEYMKRRFYICVNRMITAKMRNFLYRHIKTFTRHKKTVIGKMTKEQDIESIVGAECVVLKTKNKTDNDKENSTCKTKQYKTTEKHKIEFVSDKINVQKKINNNQEDENDITLTIKDIDDCKTLQEIDQNITSKIFRFDMQDYYSNGSSINYLDKIKSPFLIINACDDPVVPEYTIDIDRIRMSDNVFLALTMKGGHLGFMGYNWEKNYVEEIIIEFLKLFND